MMKEIKSYLEEHPLPATVTVDTVTVYEVAQEPVSHAFSALASQHISSSASANGSSRKHLFVHFGVHSQTKTFLLEQVAWNEMDFRVPDQRGFQPKSQPICLADGPIDHSKACLLPLKEIQAKLCALYTEKRMVELSTDPGRFLCNYLYYISLTESSKCPGAYSLFVHVPPFETIPKSEQLQFVQLLLTELSACD